MEQVKYMNNSFWKNRSVFVTGGTGLLGAELVSQLIENDANVVAAVRDNVSKSRFYIESLQNKVTVVHGDVVDFAFVERVIGEYEIDTVFHLAAQTIVRIANASPLSTFESNMRGTWNVLEAARLHSKKIRSVVVASSDKAYGESKILPYDEETQLKGKYPYDVSKTCTDLIAQSYWHTFKLPVNITRCGNLFGPGDLNFSRIIPGTILSVMRAEAPIIRSDGKFIRNYFFTKDAAAGYLTISENVDKIAGEAFNLGTEERFSVIEITKMILKLMDSSLESVIKNEATNEIYEQYLSIQKAKEKLGWTAKYSTEEALKETINWYKKYV